MAVAPIDCGGCPENRPEQVILPGIVVVEHKAVSMTRVECTSMLQAEMGKTVPLTSRKSSCTNAGRITALLDEHDTARDERAQISAMRGRAYRAAEPSASIQIVKTCNDETSLI